MHTAVVILATLLTISSSAGSKAHDIYSNLLDKNGAPCCNQVDCQPAHFQITSRGVMMLVYGSWTGVPDDVIQYRTLIGDTGETRGGHWCGWGDWSAVAGVLTHSFVTRCAILPPNFAS